jgi:hypothetical protein
MNFSKHLLVFKSKGSTSLFKINSCNGCACRFFICYGSPFDRDNSISFVLTFNLDNTVSNVSGVFGLGVLKTEGTWLVIIKDCNFAYAIDVLEFGSFVV